MNQVITAANATRYTGTGAFCITSANAAIVAIVCCNSATAGAIQLFGGVTASASGGKILSGVITFATISQGIQPVQIPAYGSGGLCVNIGAAANPDLTIYWSPV